MNLLKSKKINGLILVLNLGSSSLKFSLFYSNLLGKQYFGTITGIGGNKALMEITSGKEGKMIKKAFVKMDLENSINEIIKFLEKKDVRSKMVAIGYRVVQGGPSHICPELVTEKMLKDLEGYVYLAPNHLHDELKLMREFRKAYIGIPHIACFDTYFHKDMPKHSKFYQLPNKYREMGLMRYGFHGLSCESIFQQLLEEDVDVAHQKIIIAHLGSGSSMSAINRGASQDTTMGISPMGGLVMATRSGDLDPGAILFMLKQDQLSTDQLDEVLSKQSGLKAIAGTSDMQEILENRNKSQKASEALDFFCYQAKKYLGSLAAALGGIDLLVFCGGIGENAWLVREKICINMEFMGISVDSSSNVGSDAVISRSNSKVTVKVMKTDEQLMIAIHIQNILSI